MADAEPDYALLLKARTKSTFFATAIWATLLPLAVGLTNARSINAFLLWPRAGAAIASTAVTSTDLAFTVGDANAGSIDTNILFPWTCSTIAGASVRTADLVCAVGDADALSFGADFLSTVADSTDISAAVVTTFLVIASRDTDALATMALPAISAGGSVIQGSIRAAQAYFCGTHVVGADVVVVTDPMIWNPLTAICRIAPVNSAVDLVVAVQDGLDVYGAD